MQPLENPEELVGILHVEPSAVIANEDDGFPGITAVASDFNAGLLAVASVLDSVVDQIGQHLAQHRRIAAHLGQWPDVPRDLSSLSIRQQITLHVLHQLLQIDHRLMQFHTADS